MEDGRKQSTTCEKKPPKRKLIRIDLIDLNDAQAAYIQLKYNGKTLIKPTNVL